MKIKRFLRKIWSKLPDFKRFKSGYFCNVHRRTNILLMQRAFGFKMIEPVNEPLNQHCEQFYVAEYRI